MKIVHVARSSVAGVPVTLSRCLNQVSGVESTSIDINDYMYQRHGLGFKLNGADIIHWHNFIDVDLYNVTKHLKHVMHYHSDPGNDQIERVIDRLPDGVTQLTLPHYHSSLRCYRNCIPMRNVVDIHERDIIHPKEYVVHNDRLCVAFSHSHTSNWGVWQRKGKQEIQHVMARVQQHFNKKVKIKFDLIENTSYRDCMFRKSCADIVLDECVTPSYHLSSLEGLAVGRATICWIDDRVEEALLKASGASTQPFHSVYVGWLEDYLIGMIEEGPEYITNEGIKAKKWFNKFWRKEDILKEWVDLYKKL